MTDPPAARIADDVNALLRETTTHEQVTRLVPVPTPDLWAQVPLVHSVTHASLIAQVEQAVSRANAENDDGDRPVPASRPAARLEAMAVRERIDAESRDWAQRLGTRVRVPLRSRLRGLVGAAAGLPADVGGELAHAVRGWVVACRVVTGWERPTWSPNVACPNVDCEQRGTIRIRLEQGIGLCTACGRFWDSDQVRVLGEYVRWASEHLAGARHVRVDAAGFPVECTECLLTRREMADRQVARVRAGKRGERRTA